MSSQFDTTTAIVPTDDGGRYRATLCPDWNVGPIPNGGYLCATAARAILASSPHPDPLNLTAYFLRPATAGPADVTVELLKAGKRTSSFAARIEQEQGACVQVLAITGDFDALRGPDWDDAPPPELPAPEDCVRSRPPLSSGPPALTDNVDIRLTPQTAAFMRGEQGAAPTLEGWLRFADGAEPDALSLLLFADVLPPTVFNTIGLRPWVPTLELTVQLRARPEPSEWLKIRMQTRHLSRGHFEEDGEIWDARGNLVAVTRQRALVLERT